MFSLSDQVAFFIGPMDREPCLLVRVQKVMVCDSCFVNCDPFCLFRVSKKGSLLCDRPFSGNNQLVEFSSQIFMIVLILVT